MFHHLIIYLGEKYFCDKLEIINGMLPENAFRVKWTLLFSVLLVMKPKCLYL